MKRIDAAEQMDDPALPPETYAAILADLAKVNRVTLAHRPTLAFLERVLARRKRIKLLDVGFGQGDMLRAVARWAHRHGIEAELVGIDLNPNSAAVAAAATLQGMRIDWRTGDYLDLAGAGWDVVISSLVCHHMTPPQLDAFLRFMEAEARLGWFVNDLHRLRLAHMGFPLLARALGWHPIVRADGQVSIARAFHAPEWRRFLERAGIAGARIVRRFPFRLCVERIR